MNPVTFNLYLRRNADTVEEWTFTDDGVAVDFAGYTGELELRYYHGAPGAPLCTLNTVTTDVQGVRLNLGSGKVQVWFDWETINALPAAQVRGEIAAFSFDLLLTDPTGLREVWAQGDAIVDAGVTVGGA